MAILSILAAILCPVFAQAKAAARKTSCSSNLRQLGQAETLYLQDSDETHPSVYWIDGSFGNPIRGVTQRYAGNVEIYYCPDRTELCGEMGAPAARCYGYGYNWGLYNPWDDGIGLLKPEVAGPGFHDYTLPGRAVSELTAPSSTFLFGDTWSVDHYSLAPYDAWAGPGSSRHSGRLNYVYTDGHAKSVAQRHGLTEADGYVVGNAERTHAIGEGETLSAVDLKSYCGAPDSTDCTRIVEWFVAHTRFDSQR
jgi:prepilin-type processing-associated H-X9-DG protein